MIRILEYDLVNDPCTELWLSKSKKIAPRAECRTKECVPDGNAVTICTSKFQVWYLFSWNNAQQIEIRKILTNRWIFWCLHRTFRETFTKLDNLTDLSQLVHPQNPANHFTCCACSTVSGENTTHLGRREVLWPRGRCSCWVGDTGIPLEVHEILSRHDQADDILWQET